MMQKFFHASSAMTPLSIKTIRSAITRKSKLMGHNQHGPSFLKARSCQSDSQNLIEPSQAVEAVTNKEDNFRMASRERTMATRVWPIPDSCRAKLCFFCPEVLHGPKVSAPPQWLLPYYALSLTGPKSDLQDVQMWKEVITFEKDLIPILLDESRKLFLLPVTLPSRECRLLNRPRHWCNVASRLPQPEETRITTTLTFNIWVRCLWESHCP